MAITETASGPNSIAVTATATGTGATGVYAKGDAVGIRGDGKTWHGVVGFSEGGYGVYGEGLTGGTGVVGKSTGWHGIGAFSESTTGGAGLYAEATGPGVIAKSKTWHGVYGETSSTTGGVGVYGKGPIAAHFEGMVEVHGDIRLVHADCAEDFTIAADITVEPGTVMVVAANGSLAPSERAYDKRVAGVISGAGDYKPAIVLDKQEELAHRQPIALLGKVFCKVDAQFGAIDVGDLLTTSPTTGHAMKASDASRAFGAVIGKALRPLASGQGLIPILIALQ
jgi:hypothetical protein